jgi:hypothetical protein
LACKLGAEFLLRSDPKEIIFPTPTTNVGLPNQVFLPIVSRPEDPPQPVLPTPTIEPTAEPTPMPAPDDKAEEPPQELEKVYVELSMAEIVEIGIDQITLFTEYGEIAFSIIPVYTNLRNSGFSYQCPVTSGKDCAEKNNAGVHYYIHSACPTCKAEGIRRMIEMPGSNLLGLSEIFNRLTTLVGSEAELRLVDGRYIKATIASARRIPRSEFIQHASNRGPANGLVSLEFCGYVNFSDPEWAGADQSTWTSGAVYWIGISP